MMRRNGLLVLFIVAVVTILGQIGKQNFRNIGLCEIQTIEDMEKYSFRFESVEDEADLADYKQYEAYYVDAYEEMENILVAEPTGKYRMGNSCGMQEVLVKEVIRGEKELAGELVWIDDMPGFSYNSKKKKIKVDTFLNCMQKNNTYLIFCNGYGPITLEPNSGCSKYYVTDCFWGYLNLTKQKATGGIVTTKDKYTFWELKECEFFGTCQEVLDYKQKIKQQLIEKYYNPSV